MASKQEIIEARTHKVELLRQAGMNPFTAVASKTHDLTMVIENFDALETSQEVITIAGRIMALRGQGGILFIVLSDGTAEFQAVLKKDEIEESVFDLFVNTIDASDFIEVTGTLFITKRGEKSLLISKWNILTKSLMPLPDSWYGLADEEEKFRKRYLDIALDKDLKEVFIKKAKFWSVIRNFLEEKGFIEVQTPMLEVTTGGADARPFITHHNDYDMEVFMRISVGELWQKRLMAAGFPKTYEIGRAFRNEGTSPNHLQEFTNFEFYWGYADYKMGMQLVKELYIKIANDVFGITKFTTRGHEFDFNNEWIEIDYVDEIKKQTGVNVLEVDEAGLIAKLAELHVKSDAKTKERTIDALWKYCRKNISGPAFIIGYPDFIQPLAKRDRNNPLKVEQFQVLIGGAEIGKGYSELNDPIDQRERFVHQQSLKDGGDDEAMMADWEFIEMLEYGMPPTCGFGAGERLFAFLVDKTLREATLFPLVKPKIEKSEE